MTQQLLKGLLDACFSGKRITELMPPLPEKIKPRHIHVIETIYSLSEKQDQVIVRDVSSQMGVSAPSVTKLINELTVCGVITKSSGIKDRRITALALTKLGLQYHQKYVMQYHSRLIQILDELDEEQCRSAILVLEKMLEIMESHPIKIE